MDVFSAPMWFWIVCLLPELEIAATVMSQKSTFKTFGIGTSRLYAPTWFYDDESTWPGVRCQKGGRRQSPIDIKTKDVVHDFTRKFIKYGPLKFKGYSKVLVSGINNGHTIQFSTEGDDAIHPVLTGGPLKDTYRLEQLHFHWLSEHAINGVKYPLELHFVHVKYNMTVVEALTKKDGLAILSVFGKVQAELDDLDGHPDASEFMSYIPKLLKPGARMSGILLDMSKLIHNTETYYTYSGSLTSPQCNEVVTWIILSSPVFLTDEQYQLFGKVGVRHNFRSLQNISRHKVFTPAEIKIHLPQIAVFFGDSIKGFVEFFRNLKMLMSLGIKTE